MAKLVVAPMSVEKAVLDKGIEPVRPAVLTGMCRERKVELSNHLIPTFISPPRVISVKPLDTETIRKGLTNKDIC